MSSLFLRVVLLCALVSLMTGGWRTALAAPQVVIGSGTAASCQSQDAANALSNAVAAGGEITFNCGDTPVVIPVNTNATDQTVTMDGGGLVSLSGEDTRQIFFLFGSANLTLNNINLIDGAGFAGAAISVSTAQASATINNSFLISHDSGTSNGGAIYNVGTLVINNSSIGASHSGGFGGAIFNNGGTVTVQNTTIINNEAVQGGGIWQSEGSVRIENSAIRFNRASGEGGGLHMDVGTATVVNSTFYENVAAGGGGIYMRGSTLTITNATFTHNRADTGGALWNFAGTTTVKNTIFTNSRNTNDTSSSLNCDGPAVTSAGRNIVSDNTCVPNPSGVGDLLGTDPKLEQFINDNGGPTRSFMLLPDSPAIDYARDCPVTDQRGVTRPVGANCDVGAVEYAAFIYLPLITR
ncbi:MAG: right-handed parallel beta-helix repeat-containing protein [Caldilineaceae bacterium]